MKIIPTLLALVLSGCISTAQPTPQPTPTPTPETPTFEYVIEIVSAERECLLTEQEYEALIMTITNLADKEQMELATQAASRANACTISKLQDELSRRGASGWRLIHIEPVDTAMARLGIQYEYKLIWERRVR